MSIRYNIRDPGTFKWKKSSDYVRKVPIQIRLDAEVIDWFKNQVASNGGGSYQANINNVLLAHVREKSYESKGQ